MADENYLLKSETLKNKNKYELTLSEFPIFLLSRDEEDIKCIEYEDTITGKGGEIVKRKWVVYPDSKLGFGTASTFSTLFELFQIWKENDFSNQAIQFGSVYNIIKRKGLALNKQAYSRINRDLNCLVGIKIEAQNAFWDNEVKAYVDMTFHLFDSLFLYKDKPSGQTTLPFAKIKASDVIYGSIKKNSLLVTEFDSEFFYSLTPLEQRLSLYLTKIFRSQTIHKRGIVEFAQQLPLYAKQKKHIKARLKKAATGLIKKGFNILGGFNFETGEEGKELIIFRRSGQLFFGSERTREKTTTKYPKEPYEIEDMVIQILEVCQDPKSKNFYKKAARLMSKQDIYRALSETKEIKNSGEMKKNPGAIFTSIIRRCAQEQGIAL